MQAFARILGLTAPLFVLVLLGYALTRWGRWPKAVADALTRFVFAVAIPALLFRLMSDFSRLPPVDARLLIAYFGACIVVFLLARFIAGRLFRLGGVAQSAFVDQTLALISEAAVPLSLIALGMGLSEYGIREGWRVSAAITVLKLAVQPAVVWLLAWMLSLPPLETQAIVMLASLPVGANVYLMSRQFETLGGPVAASLVLSTALAAVTTPLILALIGAAPS